MTTEMQVYSQDNFPVAANVETTCETIATVAGPDGFRLNDLDRIKVPTGGSTIWEVPTTSGVEAQRTIDCVIVSIKAPRTFWAKSNTGKIPDCASGDGFVGHGTPGGDCRFCHWNKFGTGWDDSGRPAKSKACKETRRLTFFIPGQYLPMTLLVPPGSLTRIEGEKTDITTYIRRLISSGTLPQHVVTRISLTQVTGGPRPYSVVTFQKLTDIPKDEREAWNTIHKTIDPLVNTDTGILDEPSATANPVVAQRIEGDEDEQIGEDVPF